jgi:hypothetical protein
MVDTTKTSGSAATTETKGKAKHRSPNYPAISLGTAIELVRDLYNNAKRAPVSDTVAATAMGDKSLNGTTRGHISALKKFGLVDDVSQGVKVSELALRILINPEGSSDRQAAINEAAFRPEIIKELSQSHGDVADNVLKPYLVLQRGFSEAGADQFISAFRDTLALVSGMDTRYDGGMNNQPQASPGGVVVTPVAGIAQPRAGQPRFFSWPLDDDTTAEVKIVGAPVSREHLDALIEYLEVAKKRLSEKKPEA